MSSTAKDAIRQFLGPIQEFLEDETVSEIMVNGFDEIFIERYGIIEKSEAVFDSPESLESAARSIAQSVGRPFDLENPRLDARLPDGSRIHLVSPPMARKGITLSIRKFSKTKITLKEFIEKGGISKIGARFLDVCVHLGKNIIVSGGTGSGKTTILNILGSRLPKHDRLLIIEDSSELEINTEHVVNFETRKADESTGQSKVTIQDLVHSAMRLRPDRIIVGEVRGPEAIDLIQVMNTGHDGSMGTVHANGCLEACIRLETLCLMGEGRIPPETIRQMIAQALQIIVQCTRYSDGSRRISAISEIIGVDSNGQYICHDIFKWIQTGRTEEGILEGELVACGYVPSFFEEIIANKLPIPKETFNVPSTFQQYLSKKAG